MTLFLAFRFLSIALFGVMASVAWAQASGSATKLEPFEAVRLVCPSRASLDAMLPIDSLGVVSLPTGARIVLAGLDLAEAERRVRRHLEEALEIRLRSLTLVRVAHPEAPIRFGGETRKRGITYPSKGLRLSDVLKMAEPTDMADLESVEVRSGEEARVVPVNLDRNLEAWDFELRPGDKVFVPRLDRVRQVYVLGAVAKPGAFDFAVGMTAKQAVGLAGGATSQGDTSSVDIKRAGRSLGLIDFEFNDVPLKHGDTVTVPILRNAPYVLIVGPAAKAGRMYFRTGLTLQQAIEAAELDPTITKGMVSLVRVERGRSISRTFDLQELRDGRVGPVSLQSGDRIELPEPPG